MATSDPTLRAPRTWYALAGASATVFGVAVAHLAAALLNPAFSPVLVIGSVVIDQTPTPIKVWAIREFGTADKPILIGSVALGTLLWAVLASLVARRRRGAGMLGLAALIGAGILATLTRPEAGPAAMVPGLLGGVLGLGGAWWLFGRLDRWHAEPDRTEPELTEATGQLGRPGPPDRPGPGTSRRVALLGIGVFALASAGAATAGQYIVRARTAIRDIVIPAARDAGPPLPTGLDDRIPGITPFRTPTDDFYRVDTNLQVPLVDHTTWRLRIDGDVETELEFSYDDLLEMPLIERDLTMTCVSNEVGGTYVGSARWTGVRLQDLLDRAGVGETADQILSTAVDGFTISTPLEVATDGRDTMIALAMNGEPLPRDHGFPARLLTPGIYGFVGATKWLERLTLTTYRDQEAYWTERDWATDAPIKISSRIDTPVGLSALEPGRVMVGGVAWAQQRGIAAVEVRVDGGPWEKATLGPDAGVDYWRQWYFPWDAETGQHTLSVRAVDEDGEVQTAVRATPFPEGSSGIQRVVVTVS